MTDRRQGVLLGVAAYLAWGLFPLYFPLLEPAGTLEVLCCRVLFSALFSGLLLVALGRLRGLRLRRADLARLSLSAALIAVNWSVYIWAVNHGHVVEASLGYFINPLLSVALGVLVLGERLRRTQWAALGLGLAAVVVISTAVGRLPYIALALAISFACYGLVKKHVAVAAAEGLFVEAGVLVVPAIIAMSLLASRHQTTIISHGAGHTLLLVGAGLITALPLMAFAAAAQRMPLSTLGLLQYLSPIGQLAVGVWVRHEPLPGPELVGFILVWAALGMLSVDAWRHREGRDRQGAENLTPAPAANAGGAVSTSPDTFNAQVLGPDASEQPATAIVLTGAARSTRRV